MIASFKPVEEIVAGDQLALGTVESVRETPKTVWFTFTNQPEESPQSKGTLVVVLG